MLLRIGFVGLGLLVGDLAFRTLAEGRTEPRGAAATYAIDPVHSTLLFRVKHLNTAYVHGRFNAIQGSFTLDEAAPASCSVDVEVKADSIDTGNAKRDAHLKSPDFFNAAKFPTITFKSKSCTKAGDNMFEVSGDLTLHGVTKPVAVKVEKTGSGKGPKGELIGFETVFTVKRSEFGMTYMPDGISDEVRITLSVEAGKK